MRLFIAIPLPEELLDDISSLQETLGEGKLFRGKLTERENIHLTLKFLGEVDESGADVIQDKLGNLEWKSFKATVDALGVFGEEEVRIIWLHLAGAEKLQKAIDLELVDLFSLSRQFMSHITIARVKEVKDKQKLFAKIRDGNISYSFKVSSFYLMESTLNPLGPTYKVVKEYKANG